MGALLPLLAQSGPSRGLPLPEPLLAQGGPSRELPLPVPLQAEAGLPGQLAPLLEKARACIGIPYRYGGVSPKGFDCSGFVRFVFGSFGVDLNRSSGSQAKQGEPIAFDHLQPGDLLFFSTRGVRKGISHVGIYLGEGRFIHASNWGGPGKRCVRLGELASAYFANRLVSARRIVTQLAVDGQPSPKAAPAP